MDFKKITYKTTPPQDWMIHLTGWFLEGNDYQVFDSYLSAMAYQSDC